MCCKNRRQADPILSVQTRSQARRPTKPNPLQHLPKRDFSRSEEWQL